MSGYPEAITDLIRRQGERIAELEAELAALRATTDDAALIDVATERRRQIEEEGWTIEHDDRHTSGAMAAAAGCYALYSDAYPNEGQPPPQWPWDDRWWKPRNYRRDLVRGAALIVAEIGRHDRAAIRAGDDDAA